LPVASTTYQSRRTSAGLAENVFMISRSLREFVVIRRCPA
jgi:hypothetical protein